VDFFIFPLPKNGKLRRRKREMMRKVVERGIGKVESANKKFKR
jgi:hypothetical protein